MLFRKECFKSQFRMVYKSVKSVKSVLCVALILMTIDIANIPVVDAQTSASDPTATGRVDTLKTVASPETIVVTVCGLAVMVLSKTDAEKIMLGASMANHLSELGVAAGARHGVEVESLELAEHYHSIRDNCKAVRKTNERDAMQERFSPARGLVDKDEVI